MGFTPQPLSYHYYLKDHLGSTRVVVDENGDAKESYDYYPFGLKMPGRVYVQGSGITKNLFTGKELEAETGWYDLGARPYLAHLGRFPNVDPHADNYHSLSPYVYVGNNPIGFIDPTGMDSTDTQNTNNQNDTGIPETDFVYINGQKLHRNIAQHLYGSNYTSLASTSGDGNGTGENQNTQSQESNSSSHNLLYWTSNSLTATGTIVTSIEFSKVQNGMWKGANGKWYPLSWGGNQYAGSRSMVYSSANVWKIAGRTVFVAGAIVSVYQGGSALKNGNYASAIKSGLDITMGAVGTFGGPIGLGVSVVYFGIDATNGGKLTLKSVQFLGKGGTDLLPPYNFAYADGASGGEDNNPDFDSDAWDNWGSYREPGIQHLTEQSQIQADKVAAWSLSRIVTPTGGNIEIEYESDDYHYVGETFNLKHAQVFALDEENKNPPNPKNYIILGNIDPSNFYVGQKVFIHEYKRIVEYQGPGDCRDETFFRDEARTVTSIVTTPENRIYLNENYEFHEDQLSGLQRCVEDEGTFYSYEMSVPSKKVFGGGIRVKSVNSSDGINSYKTIYKYENDNGTSSGVTASLPGVYNTTLYPNSNIEYVDDPVIEAYERAYLTHEQSYGRPAPGVIYSRVDVINVDDEDQPINGKTTYEFYTALDHPYSMEEIGDNLLIDDKSGIYGKPKATTYYELYNGDEFRPVKKEEFNYAFSTELDQFGNVKVVVDGNEISQDYQPLGISQERYYFENHYDPNDWYNYIEKNIERVLDNIFNISNKSTEYYYDSPTSSTPSYSVSQQSRNLQWDALSGESIASASSNSDNLAQIKSNTPAFWNYQGMQDKNMLSQVTQETSYKTNINISNLSQLLTYTGNGFNESDILSSTVTTWSNEFDLDGSGTVTTMEDTIWHKNDTYVYNKQIDEPDGIDFIDNFDPWTDNEVEASFPLVTSESPWKMTSNITRYGPFSNPIEEIAEDGNYSTAIYDDEFGLPIAIATNAKISEIYYNDFEDGDSDNAHTGLKAKNLSSSLSLGSTPGEDPVIGAKYHVELWVKPNSGTFTLSAGAQNIQSSGTGWQLLILDDIENQQSVSISTTGNGYIDDLRIFPSRSTMSTFIYDPYTWQVTSITDPNNVTTFYEYDDYGRLVRVWDQDQNLLQQHAYHYGRND